MILNAYTLMLYGEKLLKNGEVFNVLILILFQKSEKYK